MNEDLAQLKQLLAEVDSSLTQGRHRQAIDRLRRIAAIAATLALTLELNAWR